MAKCKSHDITSPLEFSLNVVQNPDGVKHIVMQARCKLCGEMPEFKANFLGVSGVGPSNDMSGGENFKKIIFLPFTFESDRKEDERRRKTG